MLHLCVCGFRSYTDRKQEDLEATEVAVVAACEVLRAVVGVHPVAEGAEALVVAEEAGLVPRVVSE